MDAEATSGRRLERLFLVVTSGALRPSSLDRLRSELPTIAVEVAAVAGGGVRVDAERWKHGANFVDIDRDVAESQAAAITVCGTAEEIPRVALEVLTRCQRFVARRNGGSATPLWEAAVRAHRALHDCTKPLVRADLDHAVDTWQWMLRLAPDASLALQLAALFHDIERLESEADRRVEQDAPDYARFKDRHARRGAALAFEVLRGAGIDAATAARVRDLVCVHERRADDGEIGLINDADGLSFFSLNSPGYADYFGPVQTRKKVAYTLGRLGPAARARLVFIRLRDDVREHLVGAGGDAYRVDRGGPP